MGSSFLLYLGFWPVLDRRVFIDESTMADLKNAFYKEGRAARDKFDSFSRRWKAC